jgi:hypothetical protein
MRVSKSATQKMAFPDGAAISVPAIAALQVFNSKVRAGWSNEGREVFAAWILALAALVLLMVVSLQSSTSDLKLSQRSDPPVGAENRADDLLPGREVNLLPALGNTAAPGPLPQQLNRSPISTLLGMRTAASQGGGSAARIGDE